MLDPRGKYSVVNVRHPVLQKASMNFSSFVFLLFKYHHRWRYCHCNYKQPTTEMPFFSCCTLKVVQLKTTIFKMYFCSPQFTESVSAEPSVVVNIPPTFQHYVKQTSNVVITSFKRNTLFQVRSSHTTSHQHHL